MRQLFFAVGLLAVACGVGHTEDKKEEKKESAFGPLRKEFLDKFRAAKDDVSRQEAMKQFGPKFLEFAEKNPKEAEAFEALMFAFQIGSMSDNPAMLKKALAQLTRDHAEGEKIAGAVSLLGTVGGPDAAPLLKKLYESHPTAKAKPTTLTAYIGALERGLLTADAKASKDLRKQIDELRQDAVKTHKMKDLFVGAKMPELKSEDLGGKEVKLSDLKGKVVVLDMWATWCPPCRAMIPHERDLVGKMKDKPFVLVSVSFDEKKETLTKFLEGEKMPWTHWFNGSSGPIGKELGIRAFPTIYILDGEGVIRFKDLRDKDMDKAVEILVKEAEGKKASSE